MPINKQDATRALELLEQYHRQLNATEDAQLRAAIERVIKIFKSKLFNALIEIQEFYEVTLLDDNKSIEEKALETLKVADRWANAPAGAPPNQQPDTAKSKSQNSDSPPPSSAVSVTGGIACAEPGPDGGAFELVLHRAGQGFGFSIAGGVDEPHLPGDSRIYVTKVVPSGAAAVDGRMRIDDAILAVNGVDMTAVSHETAVTALKLSGNQLRLLMLRLPSQASAAVTANASDIVIPAGCVEVTLAKTSKGLGFSIAGGTDNQHLPGDNAIFVTKVIEGGAAQLDGRIEFGDRLLAVDGRPLRDCTHQAAVAALKATGDRVRLTVAKAMPGELRTLFEVEEAARMEEEATTAASASADDAGHHVGSSDSRQGTKEMWRANDSEAAQQAYYTGYEDQQDSADRGKAKSKGLGGIFGKKKK